MVLLICDDLRFIFFFPSSLTHQSTPEQSARSRIYGRHFSVNRPMDPNTLLFCAWMMSEGCSCQPSTPSDCSWLIDGLALSCDGFLCIKPLISCFWFGYSRHPTQKFTQRIPLNFIVDRDFITGHFWACQRFTLSFDCDLILLFLTVIPFT
jgi:hypothetical protein